VQAPTPTVTVSATTVNSGDPIIVTAANGPANVFDWVALASEGTPDSSYLAWRYLSDSSSTPATGLSGATLHFRLPTTPGTFTFRFFTGTTKLASSVTVTVQAPPPAALSVSALAVSPGDVITVTAANGPANLFDWVALASASAADSSYLAWRYLSDTASVPATGLTGATLHFTAPMTPGTYNFRFFTGTTKLATSATVTVQDPP
jgi:hypothetical protein